MTEKFCLKWNDFTANTTKVFGLLRKEEFLQDVTLVGDDNHQVAAHKLVLSSCSEFFKNIFKSNRHSHPLICLEGVTSTDLENILNYIYDGEVNIYQDDLDRFLNIAQRFKLEGLLGNLQQQQEEEQLVEEKPQYSVPLVSDSFAQSQNVKAKSSHGRQLARVGHDESKISMSEEEKQNLDGKVNQLVDKREDGLFHCNVCGQSAKQKIVIKNHIEAKHLEGIEIPCPICGKIFRSRPILRHHNLTTHTK